MKQLKRVGQRMRDLNYYKKMIVEIKHKSLIETVNKEVENYCKSKGYKYDGKYETKN